MADFQDWDPVALDGYLADEEVAEDLLLDIRRRVIDRVVVEMGRDEELVDLRGQD